MLLKDLSILVVDDSRAMRRIITSHLCQLRFQRIDEAKNGQAAWEMLQNGNDYHLIISDWYMPRMLGIDLLRKVRDSEKLRDTPFLMVTAEARKANLVEAVQSGVSGYLCKPFSLDDFRSKLAKIMSKPVFTSFVRETLPEL